MNDSTFNPISIYVLPVEEQDLALFDGANDLPLSHATVAYDHQRIEASIEQKARQAQLQSDAESALLLAGLFKDDAHRYLEHLEHAEAAAFALGEISYQRRQRACNPFNDPALATAWNNGYTETARQDVALPLENDLEAKLWNEGIDTDRADSQFELAALVLLRLADLACQPRLRVRAERLAQEMLCYHQGMHAPSPRRQQEIDRFLQLQTRRLATAIDFTGF